MQKMLVASDRRSWWSLVSLCLIMYAAVIEHSAHLS